MRTRNRANRLLFATLLLLTLGTPAFAYVDPGSGSFVFQMLIAGTVGALFAIKTFWGNIKSSVGRMLGKGGSESAGESTEG